MKKVVFAFARMNPPTKGHQLVIDKIVSISKEKGAEPFLFLSKSFDGKRNPLPYDYKVKIVKKFFPEVKVQDVKEINDPYKAILWLKEKGYTHIYFIAGSDRIGNYKSMKKYFQDDFKEFEIISAGERNADSDDVDGISASKMRTFVKVNDFSSFRKGLPKRATEKDAFDIYNQIKNHLNENLDEYFKNLLEEFLNEKEINKKLSPFLVS